MSGIGAGYLKLDVALVYMVSTFAVTASGAVVLAATEELLARRLASYTSRVSRSRGASHEPRATSHKFYRRAACSPARAAFRAVGAGGAEMEEEPTLWDVGKYIFTGKLELENEGEDFPYSCTCTRAGCVIDDEHCEPLASVAE